MNVFVIHSGADYEATNKVISSLKQKVYSLNTLILKNGTCFWKFDASKKIKNRRQNVNSFYISISSALVAIMGVLFAAEILTAPK